MPLLLHLLALAVFAMGTSEFMLMRPPAGHRLRPRRVRRDGFTLTSAFAVGMIVGAPLVAVLARDWL